MHRKTWARTRSAFQWRMGRISRSTVFIERKARSTRERSLYAWTACAGLRSSAGTGADDIDAIELGFGRDLVDLASPGEVAVADVEGEVFGHVLRIHDFANRQADLGRRAQMRTFAADLRLDA